MLNKYKSLKRLLITLILISNTSAYSQNLCVVNLESIKGTYTGECSTNKANGKGKSIGTDQYEGDFKEGYPDGKGMYIWKDGHYFIGNFIKGKKEGLGEMYYESVSGNDSLITGFWNKDKFLGQYEVPYKLISNSSFINQVNISLRNKKENKITIDIKAGSTGLYARQGPSIEEEQIITGNYKSSFSNSQTTSFTRILENVNFPFEVILFLNNGGNTRFLINEKGSYEVLININ